MKKCMIDTYIAIKHLLKIPLMMGWFPPFLKKKDEFNLTTYENLEPKFCMLHSQRFSMYYINGILTTDNMWILNANELSKMFSVDIVPLINPSGGIIRDIKDCIYGKVFDVHEEILQHYIKSILNDIAHQKKVIIISHSQGGIITEHIIHFLLNFHPFVLPMIEVYTFASASDSMPKGNYYAEHFANTLDYVASIGVIEHIDEYHGTVYVQSYPGHLLHSHYLKHFVAGRYCKGQSRLFSYLKNECK